MAGWAGMSTSKLQIRTLLCADLRTAGILCAFCSNICTKMIRFDAQVASDGADQGTWSAQFTLVH